MKVIILAGGFGTRISEYTYRIPKPMVKINKIPILIHIMKHYSRYGYEDFIIALGYKSKVIKDYFKKNKFPWKIKLVNTGLNTIDAAEDTYTLNQLNYKFTLESGQVALDGEGSILLEQDLSTGEPAFLLNEDFTESAIQTQSTYASNTDLDTEAGFDTASALDDILDFTERNPFGDEDTA